MRLSFHDGGRIAAVALSGLVIPLSAASPQPIDWVQRGGGTTLDVGWSVATDPADNVVACGQFTGTADFGGGPVASAGGEDLFVVRYDYAGNYLSSLTAGGSGVDAAYGVATDATGNIFVTGEFESLLVFPGLPPLVSAGGGTGGPDVFVVKLDLALTPLWAFSVGSLGTDRGLAIATGNLGNVVVAGEFENSVNFGGAPLTSAGLTDVFVAKYDGFGAHLWSRRGGGAFTDAAKGVSVDPSGGEVYVTGIFSDVAGFGPDTLVSAGQADIFVAKYGGGTGPVRWAYGYGGPNFDRGWAVDALPGGTGCYVAGEFDGNVSFGGPVRTSVFMSDAFVAKYDTAGAWVWDEEGGGVGPDVARGVAADSRGSCLVGGEFDQSATFGGSTVTGAGLVDAFLVKYDPLGNYLTTLTGGGPGNDRGRGVAVSTADDGHLVGVFAMTATFDTLSVTSAGSGDAFVAKWSTKETASPLANAGRSGLRLEPPRPNPLGGGTTIGFEVPNGGADTRLDIYDVEGRLVRTLVSGWQEEGARSVRWDTRDRSGAQVAAGIYFCRLRAAGLEATRTVAVVR